MADKDFRGMIHLNEEEMKAAGDGVFARTAAERTVGPTQERARKAAPENKDLGRATEDKDDRPALSGMTKAELLAEADRLKVAVETDDNKADLIAKIEKARNA